jgi:predicted restriction endonuclease
MACGKTVVIGLDPERRYSEAAHIKPLGNPHDGPDKAGNLLVLCPNHHLQLDRGVISLEWVGGKARFLSCIPGDNIHKKDVTLRPSHVLDEACVRWHQASYVTVGG